MPKLQRQFYFVIADRNNFEELRDVYKIKKNKIWQNEYMK